MFTVFKDETAVIENLQNLIETIANESINKSEKFFVGFSGGSLGKYLCTVLPNINTDWSKWTVFFCDERYVAEDDTESTFGFYKNNLLPKVPLTESQFVRINTKDPVEKVASDYEKTLREAFQMTSGIPSFDLLLLGVGPDGHTCSLFPKHKLLDERILLIAPILDSPKPPSGRITMTFPLIENARHSIFAVSGSGKADIIKSIFLDKENLPAAKVTALEKVHWLLDEASAIHIADMETQM
ncbi:unnamed protein product [Diamesa serratosioi]